MQRDPDGEEGDVKERGTIRERSHSFSMSGIDRKIKCIPVKETTWRNVHELKETGQSYDELLAGMIKREYDWRDWKMIAEIDRTGEYVAFDPDEILRESSDYPTHQKDTHCEE
ncbi:MAG: hypothetical protein WC525_08445 [Candidatus Thermoplasmatota archaeon]